jgi:hypothetical protein
MAYAFMDFHTNDYEVVWNIHHTNYQIIHRPHVLYGFVSVPRSLVGMPTELHPKWVSLFTCYSSLDGGPIQKCQQEPIISPPPPPPPPPGITILEKVYEHTHHDQPYYLYCETCKKLKNLCLEPWVDGEQYKTEMRARQNRQGAMGCAYDVETGGHICMVEKNPKPCKPIDLRGSWIMFFGRLLVLCSSCRCPTFVDDAMVFKSFNGKIVCALCVQLKRERTLHRLSLPQPHRAFSSALLE